MVDDLTAAGVACFGPSARAAQLEASKSFSKAFMDRQGIPTARWGSFTDPQEAVDYIRTSVGSTVIRVTCTVHRPVLLLFIVVLVCCCGLQSQLPGAGGQGQRSGGGEGRDCGGQSGRGVRGRDGHPEGSGKIFYLFILFIYFIF